MIKQLTVVLLIVSFNVQAVNNLDKQAIRALVEEYTHSTYQIRKNHLIGDYWICPVQYRGKCRNLGSNPFRDYGVLTKEQLAIAKKYYSHSK